MPSPTPSSTNNWIEAFKALAPIGTWILVIVGWAFVRWDNNRREDRRDVKARIDSLIKDVRSLEDKAYEYYQTDPATDVLLLEMGMKRDQDALDARLGHLRKSSVRFQEVHLLSVYWRVLTGSPFAQSNRPKMAPGDPKFKEISSASNDLISYLEDEYDLLYTAKAKKRKP